MNYKQLRGGGGGSSGSSSKRQNVNRVTSYNKINFFIKT